MGSIVRLSGVLRVLCGIVVVIVACMVVASCLLMDILLRFVF